MPKEFEPGKHQTIIFQITNYSNTQSQPQINLDLPVNWTIITAPPKISLNPNETKKLIYAVSPNANANYGEAEIAISISMNSLEIDNKKFVVNVKKTHNVILELIDKPKYLKDEDDFTCKYMITNKGNCNEKIVLVSRKGIINGNTDFVLPIDSSKIILVNQFIPKSNTKQIIVNDLSVFLQEADTTFSKNVPITVYPNQSKKSSIYLTFPIEGSFLYNSIDNTSQNLSFFQYDMNGKGYLDRKEKHYLEFIAKGATDADVERFETINRHQITYRYLKSSLKIGDFTFGLSRLLENVRLGRGLLFSQDFTNFNISFFYNKLLFFPEIKEQLGSSITIKKDNNYLFKLNSIHRIHENSQNNSTAFSVLGNYNKENLFIKGEYATSLQKGIIDFGSFASAFYKGKRLQFALDIMYTGEDFQGFYNNSLFNASSLNFKLNKNFSFSASANYNLTNPRNDSITAQIAPFNKSYSGALQFSKNKNSNHRLAFIYRNNLDRSEIEKFNYTENSLRYSFKYKVENFNSHLSCEIASTKNKISPEQYYKGISYNFMINLNYSFKKKIRFGIFSDYSKTNRYTYNALEYLFYGGSLFYNPNNKLNLSLNYRNNFPLEEFYKTNSIFNVDFKYKFNTKNSLSFLANYSQPSNSNKRDLFLTLRYDINLNIPISKDRNLGHLKGKINCSEHDIVDGIIVNLNEHSSITNERGEFEFLDLLPGKYFLTVDQLSYNRNYIFDKELPLEITTMPKITDSITIHLIKPVTVNGKIIYEQSNQIQSKEFKNKIPKLVVKLENESEQFLTIMNENGEFSFNEIKPGNWTISIVTKGLENKFIFLDNFKSIILKDGDNKMIEFLVKDKERKINIKSTNQKLKVK